MLMISARDNENNRWKGKATKNKDKGTNGDASYSESVRATWLYCAFKLGFLKYIFKPPLIFKSNLEFALSIILKYRELYESKYVVVERRCLKI